MSRGKHGITVEFEDDTGKQWGGYAIIGYEDYDRLVPGAEPLSCEFYYYENEKGGHMPWNSLPADLQTHINGLVDEENEQLARNRGR